MSSRSGRGARGQRLIEDLVAACKSGQVGLTPNTLSAWLRIGLVGECHLQRACLPRA